jgi:hypothetical protein
MGPAEVRTNAFQISGGRVQHLSLAVHRAGDPLLRGSIDKERTGQFPQQGIPLAGTPQPGLKDPGLLQQAAQDVQLGRLQDPSLHRQALQGNPGVGHGRRSEIGLIGEKARHLRDPVELQVHQGWIG